MTYATLTQVKEELNIASAITTSDTELDDLLTLIDDQLNTRLKRFTSLPLQSEMLTYLGDLEARIVVARYRLRRATPQEQQQYQVIIQQIEAQFMEYLKNNFQTSFFGQGSRSEEREGLDLGQWNESDAGIQGGW